jgi:hypothetical protein
VSLSSKSDFPSSLLGVTIRRSTVLGRFFLLYGIAISLLLGVLLDLTAQGSFASAFPVFLPIFGTVGSMGGLAVFSSDRMQGTLEYFLAYGVSPRRLFTNVLLACLALVTIVLGIALGVGVGLYLARGNPFTTPLALELGVYAVPMTYVSASFATIIGTYWSALSSPRTGMSSPIGLAPFVGILPPTAVLAIVVALEASGTISGNAPVEVAVSIMAAVAAVTLTLLALSGHLLRRERLLSPR